MVAVEVLNAQHLSLLHLFHLAVRQHRGYLLLAERRDRNLYGLRLFGLDAELRHVVCLVGTEHADHGPLLALGVDDHGARSSLERHERAQCPSVLVDEKTVAAGQQ